MAHLPKGQGVFLPPFKAWLASNIPAVYDNTMTYYEELCALIKYLQDIVVPALNNNAAAITTISTAVEQLQKYVDDYFKNLDVQEEINNKLDEMAEDGTLQNLILAYLELNPMITFNTLSDAQENEQLINGSTFKTLGKETLNDGYGAIYKVGTESTDIALANNLYARIVDDFGGNNYYDEITVTQSRANDTDYYIATIPLNDDDGHLIGLSVIEDSTNTPLSYGEKHLTTLTTNAGLTRQNSLSQWKQGAIISNGVALHGDLCDVDPQSYMSYIGFKADRSVLNFPATTTTDIMLAQGITNAFLTFGQMITNGVKTIPEEWSVSDEPRFNIGVKLDGTIIIFGCDGRTERDSGMTMDETADIMLGLGVVNAWRCDGGGSTSIVWKGCKQNRNIDGDATEDRDIHVTLNFKKETIDKELGKVYSFIGKERQLMNKQLRKDFIAKFEPKRSSIFYANYNANYNKITDADTEIPLALQATYRHGEGFTSIKDTNNRVIGFTCNIIGLIRVTINECVLCKNVDGKRIVRLDKTELGNLANYWTQAQSSYFPTADGDVCNVTMVTTVNNTVEGTNYYFGAKGQVGDDFNRTYITVEEVGWAAS